MSNHDPEQPIVMHEDPLAGPTWTYLGAGAFVFVASVIAVAALLYEVEERTTEEFVLERPVEAVVDLKAEQEARLASGPRREFRTPADTGDEAAIVIPVDDAIDLVLGEFGPGS